MAVWASASRTKTAGRGSLLELEPSHGKRLEDKTKRNQTNRQVEQTPKAPDEDKCRVPKRIKWDETIDETNAEHVRHHATAGSSGGSSSTAGDDVEM